MIWREAVIAALHRFSAQHQTRKITRQQLIEEQLDYMISVTQSQSETPGQTLSRVLQELRQDNILYFEGNGIYVLLDTPLDVEQEELQPETIDFAIQHNKLYLGSVNTTDTLALTRRRKGQERLRQLTLDNYKHQCAFCDVIDPPLLVTSHISRWADDVSGRGDLANTMCLCRFHDTLFEHGYFSLTNDYQILKPNSIRSYTVQQLLNLTNAFHPPSKILPNPIYLQKHRFRCHFEP